MLFIPVWPEQIRYVTHPPDPRYTGATFETRYPPTPTAPAPSQPVYRESGVHLPFLTYEQQQQIYGTTPQVIRQMLPRPVEPTTYTKFEYLSTLGYQRERLELRKDLFDKDVYKPSIDWYTSTEKLVRGTPSGTVFRKTDTGVEYFSPIEPVPEKKKEVSILDIVFKHTPLYKVLSPFKEPIAEFFMPIGERVEFVKESLVGTVPTTDWSKAETPYMRQLREMNIKAYEQLWGSGDIGGLGVRVLSSPPALILSSYGLGAGIGAFKATTFGGKALLSVGKHTVTPAKILESGIVGVSTGQTVVEGVRDPYGTIKGLAVSLPFVIGPYRWGHVRGMGFVQRKAALGKVSGLERVRQTGLYETFDVTMKLREPPRLGKSVFDIAQVEKVGPSAAVEIGTYLTGESKWGVLGGRPRISGSTAMKIQLGEYFRTGDLPTGLGKWAEARQYGAWMSGVQKGVKPKSLLKPGSPIVDVDLLVRGRLGGLKRADVLKKSGVHVHTFKVGGVLEFGAVQLPSTKGKISIGPKILDVKILPVREQFLRSGISLLPSESPLKGYRTFKDVGTWYDTGTSLMFQKRGLKLQSAMEKVISPEKYSIPKVTFAEKVISKIAGGKFIDVAPSGELYYKIPGYPRYAGYVIGLIAGGYKGYPFDKYVSPVVYKPSKKVVIPGFPYSPFKPKKVRPPPVIVSPPPYYKPPPDKQPPYIPTYKPPPDDRLPFIPIFEEDRRKLKRDITRREGLAFRFREWKPGVYKYVSPFKPFNKKGGLGF